MRRRSPPRLKSAARGPAAGDNAPPLDMDETIIKLERLAKAESMYADKIAEFEKRCLAAQKMLGLRDGQISGAFQKDRVGNWMTDTLVLKYREKKHVIAAAEADLSGKAARSLRALSNAFVLGAPMSLDLLAAALECGAIMERLGTEFEFDRDPWPDAVERVAKHVQEQLRAASPAGNAKSRLVAEEVAKWFGKTGNAVNGYALMKAATKSKRKPSSKAKSKNA